MLVNLLLSALVLLVLSCNSICVLVLEFLVLPVIAFLRALRVLSSLLGCTFTSEIHSPLASCQGSLVSLVRHALLILTCSCLRMHCLQFEVALNYHVILSLLAELACH